MRVFSAVTVLFGVLLLWAGVVEPRLLLDVQETEAQIDGLPPMWEGRRVALLADLQTGMWLANGRMVRRAVNETLEAEPDLVLLAGDFVYRPDSSVVRRAVELLRPLAESGIPTFAVLGNHDYSLAKPDERPDTRLAAYLTELLEAAGIDVLENEAVRLDDRSTGLHLVGVGSEWAERSRPDLALAGIPDGAPRLHLMHNPVTFRDLAPHTAPLVLSAHTHGGQVRLPFLPSQSWLNIARPREVVADGWSADSIGGAGNRLYVNRGIGFSVLPIRIFCRPEVTLLTLRGDSAPMDPGAVE